MPSVMKVGGTSRLIYRRIVRLALAIGLLTGSMGLAATFTVTNAADSGPGTLRAAFLGANSSGLGPHPITFNIQPPGPVSIAPLTALPILINAVTIDATTQPGFAGKPIVELNGRILVTEGLHLSGGNSTVRGLVINRFLGSGIVLDTKGSNVIRGNFIGPNVACTTNLNNGDSGISIGGGADFTLVGGTNAGDGNVLSGAARYGIGISGSHSNLIQGNLIGVDATSSFRLGNDIGVMMQISSGTQVGGAAPEAGNVIGGNWTDGIQCKGGNISYLVIQGNWIGTDRTRTRNLGNGRAGIWLSSSSTMTVGGTNSGAGNTIAFNSGDAIALNGGYPAILGNSIYSNVGWGIGGGPVNFPVLASASQAASNIVMTGTLTSLATRTYRLEFFANPGCSSHGYGEGRTFLGWTNVTTDTNGNASFSATLTTNDFTGQVVTATATGPDNQSSGFSTCQPVISISPPTITYIPQDKFVMRLGETNSLLVLANSSVALYYQWFRGGVPLLGQTNRTLWFNGVQPSDLGVYSVVVSNAYGAVGPLSAALKMAPGSGIVVASALSDSGPGSLRQAILDANASAVPATIYFNFSGPGPFTIRLTSPLPSLMQPTLVDGTTVPGYAGQPLVELDGGGMLGDGLVLVAGHCTVRGLSIVNFGGSGLRIDRAGTNLVEGNFIGLRSDGTNVAGNGVHGILVMSSVGNQIGGSTPASRNVISGNLGEGIRLDSSWTSNTIIQGNFIGTDASGNQPRGNGGSGIEVADAVNNLVGGTNPGEGNWIANNGRNGVMVLSGTCAVLGNEISANKGLGIDLGGDGPTPNDAGDYDTGPNGLQNSPEIVGVNNGPSGTSLWGVLQSAPNTPFHIEFFAGTKCGDAQMFLGSLDTVSDAFGDAIFSANFLTADISGMSVTATATDPDGNTSEFSPCQRVAVPPYISAQPVGQTVLEGEAVSFSVLAAGAPPLQYQWLRNGTPVPGATNATLSFNPVSTAQAGTYTVVVTNPDGKVVSDPAILAVLLPTLPVLTGQPQNQTVLPGATVVFSAGFSGVGPFAIQWRLNGVNLDGATNSTLVLNNVQVTNSGSYSVVVSTAAGSANSASAVLTVQVPALGFKDNFASLTKLSTASGTGRSSNVLATAQTGEPLQAGKPGGKSIWIMWQAPASGIATFTTAGSTFDTLLGIHTGTALTNLVEVASDDDSGGFHTSAVNFNAVSGKQYLIAVDGFGGASGDVVLNWSLEATPESLPLLVTQPSSQTVAPGGAALLTVATSGPGLTYQWFFNGQLIPGAISNQLVITSTAGSRVGKYSVRISNATRSVTSQAVMLEMNNESTAGPPIRSANKFLDGFGTALTQ